MTAPDNNSTVPALPQHDFWQFSVRVYQQASIQQVCLELQNRCGANVNLLLFCCWSGIQGYRHLEISELREYLASIYQWHHAITLQLRRLRNCVPKQTGGSALQKLRPAILDVELAAEQCEQLMLAERLSSVASPQLAPRKKLLNAITNLKNYTRLWRHTLTKNDYQLLTQLLGNLFTTITTEELHQLCEVRLRF